MGKASSVSFLASIYFTYLLGHEVHDLSCESWILYAFEDPSTLKPQTALAGSNSNLRIEKTVYSS